MYRYPHSYYRPGWRAMAGLFTACKRTCICCFKVVQWIPVIFVSAVLIWGYYVYVFEMNISGKFPKPAGSPRISALISALLLLLAHVLLILQLVSYVRTIFTKHKEIPDQFCLTDEQVETLEELIDGQPFLREVAVDLPVRTLTKNGCVRYCDTCEAVKPDRCHHCSVCGRCILKMDHHCPWVNNCVGYSNYKFFVLFLFYTVVLCLFFCVTGLYDVVRAWNGTLKQDSMVKFNVIFCFFMCACFALSTGVLLFFHLYLVMANKSTLENMGHPITAGGEDRKLFHLGIKRNLQQVFGKNCLLALLPVHSSQGDGASFPTRRDRNTEDIEWNADCEDIEWKTVTVGSKSSRNRDPEPRTSEPDQGGLTSGDDSEVEIFAVGESAETQPLTQTTKM